jgi:lipoprotein-anchoring transpeptidase ErfK/SrfK
MRKAFAVSVLFACAAAGVLSAFALAGGTFPNAITTTITTLTGTTLTTTTTTTPTTTTTRTVTTPRPLPEGVSVGGIPVGNLLPSEATVQVKRYFSEPLELSLGRRVYRVDPNILAAPHINRALTAARRAAPFANLPLDVKVRTPRLKDYVAKLASRITTPPVDSRLILRNLKPYLTPDRPGVELDRTKATASITRSLRLNIRDQIVLRTTSTPPTVTRSSFGPVVVIHRGTNLLYLYRGMRQQRIFAVATGQAVYPTPLGAFQIVVKWRNPWWYPPASPWAAGEKPIPPGPSNPLGTRWMGLSAPGVGIHGTNNDASIGYSVSHGCIRMHVHDAEWLFNHVDIGTRVFIVSA